MTQDKVLEFAARFDHAALYPEVGLKEIEKVCREAAEHKFYSVAINPVWVRDAARLLHGTGVKVLSVSGFPLSAHRTDTKVFEAVKGVSDGAAEIDMVVNVGWLASDRFKEAEDEITQVRKALPHNVILKVIIEAGKLSEEQQRNATRAVINGGAQFVKTCTGFFGGATVEQVRVLHEAASGQIEVKASGGIKTLSQCRELLAAGATRLGCSSSVKIMAELANEL
ncbi:MAG TPA: deoxyribose-phosphate aldolase [candidate division Zixibacteria bacterium]|nr:deoxyribose-phosphate aldolase [candidate division Zixibacteria bacterium]